MDEITVYKKIVRRLSLLWIISYGIVSIVGFLLGATYFFSEEQAGSPRLLLILQHFSPILLAVFFLPLLRMIHKYAKKAQWNTFIILSNILSIFLLACIGMYILVQILPLLLAH